MIFLSLQSCSQPTVRPYQAAVEPYFCHYQYYLAYAYIQYDHCDILERYKDKIKTGDPQTWFM